MLKKKESHHKWILVYLKGKHTIQREFKSRKQADRIAKRHTYYLLERVY